MASQRILEQTLKKFQIPLMIPCKYPGCNTKVHWQSLEEHHGLCSYRPYICPYRAALGVGSCSWQGPVAAMTEHCKTVHLTIIMEKGDIWLHESVTKLSQCNSWILLPFNVLVVTTQITRGGGPELLPIQSMWFLSLTPAKIPLRVTAHDPYWKFKTDTILCAPSILMQELTPFVTHFRTHQCMSNLIVPLSDQSEITMHVTLADEGTSLKRPLKLDGDNSVEQEPPPVKRARINDVKEEKEEDGMII